MLKLEIRPSLRLVQQIGKIERFAGNWDRLSESSAVAPKSLADQQLLRGSQSALELDSTSPAAWTLDPRPEIIHPVIKALVLAHTDDAAFDLAGLDRLFRLVTGTRLEKPERMEKAEQLMTLGHSGEHIKTGYRDVPAYFLTPGDEVVFPTVSAFLVETRLAQLIEWTARESRAGVFHPLFVIGSFYLLFLQIHPYPTGNHRLAQVLLWRLLTEHGYQFVRYFHPSSVFIESSKSYFTALRQAEKNTYQGSWATLNVWLEFFLEALLTTSQRLAENSEKSLRGFPLSGVQKRIISIVKESGSASRDKIAKDTGINLSTVKYNLSVLADKGHLKRIGGGRTTRYTLI